jgi:hypothetical protein
VVETMRRLICLFLFTFLASWPVGFTHAATQQTADSNAARTWIEQMKKAPKGPFSNIRWFCKDGTVLPPTPYACRPHGGGHQHGEWSERTSLLRSQGYMIANFLADLDPEKFTAQPDYKSVYKQLLNSF